MLFADVSPVARPPALPGDVRFDGASWDGPRNALNVAEEVQPWPGEGEGGGSALALLSALERRVADRLWDPEAWWRREVERNGARPCALQMQKQRGQMGPPSCFSPSGVVRIGWYAGCSGVTSCGFLHLKHTMRPRGYHST